jgi:hypothetical protein
MDNRKNNKGGRPRGSENKCTVQARDLIDRLAKERYGKDGFGAVINKMFELVDGVTLQYVNKKGEEVIYTEKPDAFAVKVLMEYRFGKAPQPIVGENNDPIKLLIEYVNSKDVQG